MGVKNRVMAKNDKLYIYETPEIHDATLLIGLSGWMNGGRVSTETVGFFIETLDAEELAEIDADEFFIQSFPGPMEIAALFRPHAIIEDGLVTDYEPPSCVFYYSQEHNLILFEGDEPHLRWDEFTSLILNVCRNYDVRRVYFIGSVADVVPHSREPRIRYSGSDEEVIHQLSEYNFNISNYEGPASISTYLTVRCQEEGIKMANLVAAIPVYIDGRNPKCVETLVRLISKIIGVKVDLTELREDADKFEKKLTEIIESQPELAERIHQLEEDYDKEVFNREMGDLKNWLEQRGIRVD